MPTENKPESEDLPKSEASESTPDEEESGVSDDESTEESTTADAKTEDESGDAEESAPEDLEPTELEILKGQVDDLSKKVIDTEKQLSEAKKDIDYAKAETQTVIRRGREDTARAVNRSKRDLMSRLMNVADTFHQTRSELEKFEKDEKSEVVLTAVEMAIKEFDKVLGGEGLELLNPVGESFDPQFHEAQAMVPSPDKEPGTVMDVLRVGYTLDGNLLRAPQVVVVAEPAKDESEATSEDS